MFVQGHGSRTRLLVTGFGPFPGVPFNASAVLAARAAGSFIDRSPDVDIVAATLPTEWRAGLAQLDALWERLRPVAALHFGVSDRAAGLVLERTAHNACCDAVDACGAVSPSDRLDLRGPATLQTSLPVSSIERTLARRQVPGCISDDPGRYLCNAVYYHSLMHAQAHCAHALFVHIPSGLATDAKASPASDCPLDWTIADRGAHALIEAALALIAPRQDGDSAAIG